MRLSSVLMLVAAGACGSDGEPGNDVVLNPGLTPEGGMVAPDGGALPDAALPVTDSSVQPGLDATVPVGDAGVDGAVKPDGSSVGDAAPQGDAALPDGSMSDGAANDGGGTGIGLEGTGLSVFPTTGQPLDTPSGSWKYHEFPDAQCRRGTKAGITVFKNSASKKLFFFFEGGGACFNAETCGTNPEAVDATDKAGPSGGILDRTNAANPLKDWNVVYVPYCTGDVFGGTKANGKADGVTEPQQFVGFLNTKAFLQRVVPTFADATDVLVTGVSAGGFGASTSVLLIQRAFPNVKVKMINDSGPPMPGRVLPSCLQKWWRETWGYDESILKDCGASCPNKDDYTMDYGLFLGKTFGNRFSGLIETTGDFIISGFFGIGANNCTGSLLFGPRVPAADFESGLLEFREKVKQYSSFGTYFPKGDQHTWLMGPSFYTSKIGDTTMVNWVTDIINEKGTKHVGP